LRLIINYIVFNKNFLTFEILLIYGDWGLGIGDWPNPQSPIPNPQSPIPKLPKTDK